MSRLQTHETRGRIAGLLLVALVGLVYAGIHFYLDRDPLRSPWLTAPTQTPETLPLALDLTQAEEASRWYRGPGVQDMNADSGGLLAQGEGDGFHISRRFLIPPGFLGQVVLHTSAPHRPPLRVTPYIHGKAKPEHGTLSEIDPKNPLQQVARFQAGFWDWRSVEGIRIEPSQPDTSVQLARVEISSEKWGAVSRRPGTDEDWHEAFSGDTPQFRNVLLILVDTLRSDRMSLYGYERPTTPGLDALARHAVVFEKAHSQAACTFPSVNSLLTSQPPAFFLRQPPEEWAPLDRYHPIAERLAERGFRNLAVSSSWVVRASESHHNNWGGGYDAGFDIFDETCAGLQAACVNRRAVDLIDSTDAPWFLYLHYIDTHDPYRPPAATHEAAFANPYSGPEEFKQGDPNPISEALYVKKAPQPASQRDIGHLSDLYDEEILYLDGQLTLLFAALRDRNLLDKTLIALVSDHGEEFLEHGHIKHCRSVHETEISTPLMLWIPGETQGNRIRHPAQNIDVVPTLLDYVSGGMVPPGMAGRSLRPSIEGNQPVNRYTFSQQGSFQALADGRYKLILDQSDGSTQLFDLQNDPQERIDIASQAPDITESLKNAMESRHPLMRAPSPDETKETLQNLRALGYSD